MKRHFSVMAAYNRWANARLYDMAAALPDELYRKPIDIYFKNLHGTLNHILTADRIWMYRLEGKGDHPSKLNAIIHADIASLRTARLAEDQRIVSFVDNLDDPDFEKLWEFQTLNGTPQRKYVREILAHMFNHQTHHRGQAHAALTVLGVSEPAPLDLLIMLNQ